MDTQPSNEETTVAPPVVQSPVVAPPVVVAPVAEPGEAVAPRSMCALEIAEELLTRVLATPLCEDGCNIMAFLFAPLSRVCSAEEVQA